MSGIEQSNEALFDQLPETTLATEQVSEPIDTEPAHGLSPERQRQVMRLVRLGKNFERAVKGTPNAQQLADEHHAVVRTIHREPPQSLDGMRF